MAALEALARFVALLLEPLPYKLLFCQVVFFMPFLSPEWSHHPWAVLSSQSVAVEMIPEVINKGPCSRWGRDKTQPPSQMSHALVTGHTGRDQSPQPVAFLLDLLFWPGRVRDWTTSLLDLLIMQKVSWPVNPNHSQLAVGPSPRRKHTHVYTCLHTHVLLTQPHGHIACGPASPHFPSLLFPVELVSLSSPNPCRVLSRGSRGCYRHLG